MKSSNLFKKIMLIFISILFIILLLVLLYLKTDLFKTTDQLFKKYLISSAIESSTFNLEPYTTISNRMQNEKMEIECESEIDIPSNTYDTTSNETKKISLKETIQFDLPNKNMSYLFDFKNNGKDFFKINFLKTDNTYGIHIPEIHDKYLSIENRDFKKLAKTFEIPNDVIEYIPNELPQFTFTKDENAKLKELTTKYVTKISDSIDTSLYSKEEFEMVNLDGKNIEGNKYILTISEDKLSEILANTYTELENDEEFQKLIEGKAIKLFIDTLKEIEDSMQNSITDYMQNDTLDSNYDFESENSITEETIIAEPKDIKICLYAYKGITQKLEIISTNGNITEISINNQETKSELLLKTIAPKDEYNEVALETILDLSNTYNNNNGELTLLMQSQYNKDDIETVKKENKSEDSFFADFYDDEYYTSMYKDTEIKLNMVSKVNHDIINITSTYTEPTEDDSTDTEVDFTVKFDSNLDISILTDKNKLVLNDYTLEDFTTLGTEILNNIEKSAKENPETLIGSIINQKLEEEKEEIQYYKEYVDEEIRYAIESNLDDYHFDLLYDETVNPTDYLTLDNIKYSVGYMIDEIEMIDSSTLKCIVDEYTYFVLLNIDTNEWNLNDLIVLYSEDGTFENAM